MQEHRIQQNFGNEAFMLSLAPLSPEFVAQEMRNPNSAIFKIYLSACMSVMLERMIEAEALRFFQMLFLLNEAEVAKRNAANEYDRQQALNNDLYLLGESQEYKDCVEILWSYPALIEIVQEMTKHLMQLVTLQNNQPALLQAYQNARANFANHVVQGLRNVLGNNGTIALPNGVTVDIDLNGPAIQAMQGKMAARPPITQVLAPHVNPVLHQHVQTLQAEELAALQKTKSKDYVPSVDDLKAIEMKVIGPQLKFRKVVDSVEFVGALKRAMREKKTKEGEPDIIESLRGAGVEKAIIAVVEKALKNLSEENKLDGQQQSLEAEQELINAGVSRNVSTNAVASGYKRLSEQLENIPGLSSAKKESLLRSLREKLPVLANLDLKAIIVVPISSLGHKR